MRLDRLELSGFRSYREPESIEFGDRSLVAITGAEFSGKSSLIEAIAWALLGHPGRSLVSTGAKQAEVKLEFSVGDKSYRVVRITPAKGSSKSWLDVKGDDGQWSCLSERLVTDAALQVRQVLGMDADVALATWLSTQGETGHFGELIPSKRRELLVSAFNLGIYERMYAQVDKMMPDARSAKDKAKGYCAALQARLEALGDQVDPDTAEATLKSAQDRIAELNTQLLDDPGVKLTQIKAEYARRVAIWDRAKARIEADNANLSTLQRSVAELTAKASTRSGDAKLAETTANLVEQAEQAVTKAAKAHSELSAKIAAAKARVLDQISRGKAAAAERDHLTQIAGQDCPVCLRPLDEVSTNAALATLEAGLESMRSELGDLRNAVVNLGVEVDQSADVLAEANVALSLATKDHREAVAAFERSKAADDRLETEQSRLSVAQSALASSRADLEALDEPVLDETLVASLVALQDQQHRAGLEAELAQARDDERQAQIVLARIPERTSLEEAVEQAIGAELDAVRGFDDLDLLRCAFKPSGIPAMILPALCAEVSDEANLILEDLGADGLSLDVSVNDKDDVIVEGVRADGPRDYKTFSGSEKFRLSLALRVGLCRCVAKRTGVQIGTLIIDEGFGTLRETSQGIVANALSRLSKDMNILVVTHVEALKSRFDHRLEVSCETGTSRATWIG